MEKELFEVKRERLTYNEFVDFLAKALAMSKDEDGKIIILSKILGFKIMFARYYLDVELPESDIEAYEMVSDIDYYDYSDKIDWNQFCDLERCFEEYCDEANDEAHKDINDAVVELVMSLKRYVDNMNDSTKELDLNKTLAMMNEFKDVVGNLDTNKAMEFFLNKAIEEGKKKKTKSKSKQNIKEKEENSKKNDIKVDNKEVN